MEKVEQDVGVVSGKQAEKPTRWVSETGKQVENPEPETKWRKWSEWWVWRVGNRLKNPKRWVSETGKQAENPELEIELEKQKQKPRAENKSNF